MMALLLDTEGFVQPAIFLGISLILLFVTYKKHTKWLWIAVLPVLALYMYQGHIEDVRLLRSQEDFLTSTWNEIYEPLTIRVEYNEEVQPEHYDEWVVQTDGGEYHVHFHKDETDGFEMYDIIWETEPLAVRREVLSTLRTLNIDGTPVYNDQIHEYSVITNEEDYTISLNEKGRVDAIIDADNHLIYKNEEGIIEAEGRPLTEEEVK